MKIYCIFLSFFLFCSFPALVHNFKNNEKARFVEIQSESRNPSIVELISSLMGMLSKLTPSPSLEPSSELGPEGPSMIAPPRSSPSGFNKFVDKAAEQAVQTAVTQLENYNSHDEFNKAVLVIAGERLKKFWYIGQCRRNYTIVCPNGWTERESGSGFCMPNTGYAGPCRPSSFKNTTAAQKEDFAWRCEAEWPCLNSPARNFTSTCPMHWKKIGGSLCIASPEYKGYCSVATDFAGYTDEMKALWASKCDAEWPPVIPEITAVTKAFVPIKPAVSRLAKKINGPVTEQGIIMQPPL